MAVGLKSPENLLPVNGVRLSVVASEMRYSGRDDLVLMIFDDDANTAAVFTKNRYCAAPVTVAKKHIAEQATKALLINAGNANAGTGKQGHLDAIACCEKVAEKLNCDTQQVLPFSTGVIGMPLPMDKFLTGIDLAVDNVSKVQQASSDWLAAANAIMTTDTMAKGFSEQLDLDGNIVTITGIAKGSGMICPNMATMLSYIVTDANVSSDVLKKIVNQAAQQSFNRITVDGDTSTNDALTLTATGKVGDQVLTNQDSQQVAMLSDAVISVAIKLAQAIIRDGEGATKFVEINVTGAESQADCETVAYTVAHSPLVKTALFASDPNWGRILAAVGRAPIQHLNIEKVGISVNGVAIIELGEPASSYSEELGQQAFSPEDIVMDISLGDSQENCRIWTNDLSHDYISINADYRS